MLEKNNIESSNKNYYMFFDHLSSGDGYNYFSYVLSQIIDNCYECIKQYNLYIPTHLKGEGMGYYREFYLDAKFSHITKKYKRGVDRP